MIDRSTKAILFAIALGLWINAFTTWARPVPLSAQGLSNSDIELAISSALSEVKSSLSSIKSDVANIESDVDDIEDGSCSNDKMC
jgi:hypothetical protein